MQKQIITLTVQRRLAFDPDASDEVLAEMSEKLEAIGWTVADIQSIEEDTEPHISDADDMELDEE